MYKCNGVLAETKNNNNNNNNNKNNKNLDENNTCSDGRSEQLINLFYLLIRNEPNFAEQNSVWAPLGLA